MEIGIIGLPQSGKTSLFNALTGQDADLGYAGGRKSHRAVAKIPDSRLERLTELFKPHRQINATVDYLDLGGLDEEIGPQHSFPAEFLQAVRVCDAILLTVRAFVHPDYPHPAGPPDPVRDLRLANDEFLISDLTVCEGRIERLEKQLMKQKDQDMAFELETLRKCHAALEEERPLRMLGLDRHQLRALKSYAFLSLKPQLAVFNVGEDGIGSVELLDSLAGEFDHLGLRACQVCARIEMELAQLDPEEAAEFLEEYGIAEPALDRVLRESFELLELETFFTASEEECHAWTIRRGSTAREAAGVIHSDMERGFIRAEIVPSADLIEAGSLAVCRERGSFRLEGKDYVIREGEVIHIRFNV